ncbi:anhydro-N-acetylmuramic acid kinase [Novilysobacter antarcticus]|uniref:anhydro-N-acetylmuramic acid kinase n=1 Tax=Novilysobacter antarcticus TaxID=2862543 RepID=UPI001C99CE13|nr:anhydro-N-acetylmuramic acid kinase [Lysobacter antarcticus]
MATSDTTGPADSSSTGPAAFRADDRRANGLFIGLMSGTSADGIDAALVRFDAGTGCTLLHGHTCEWDLPTRARLLELGQGAPIDSIDELGTLDVHIAECFADAALQLIRIAGVDAAQVRAIGSHGQTVRHRPNGAAFDGRNRFTMQLGDGNVIAERTGIATVADFRRRDVAAGGQGAPLLPALHAAMLRSDAEHRAVLNLGGIANLTLLPASCDGVSGAGVRGFDTGPANALMDAWCQRQLGQAFDRDGAFARRGKVDETLLARLLNEPWFAQPPPKSTGREQFQLQWLQHHLREDERPEDVQATLLELTAATVADALLAQQPHTARVLVCGGGVHNPLLLRRLAARLPDVAIESTAEHGVDPDHVEAMGFAWLARQTLAGLAGNLPAVTGARGPRTLGVIYPA